jgi:hypothetical protein
MADIKQAVIWLQEGKKIRRKKYFPSVFIDCNEFSTVLRYHLSKTCIIENALLNFMDLIAEDWELYEESEF